jgi:hypothetical protein
MIMNFKKLTTTTCLLAFSAYALIAQQDSTSEYIEIGPDYQYEKMETFQKGNQRNGGFFAFDIHYGQIEGENAVFPGVKFAYVINSNLEIGFRGTGIFSEIKGDEFLDGKANIMGGYGGLHISSVLFPFKKVHVAFPIFLGAGAVGYDENIRDRFGPRNFNNDFDEIFLAEIGANIVFNITKNFQIDVGARYMRTTDIELDKIQNLDINGVTAGFGLRFGWF